MSILVTDPQLEERLKEQRQAWGADRYDEVWEGIYMMAPLPNNEHQRIVRKIYTVLDQVVSTLDLGEAFPGVNLSGIGGEWQEDYRVPDVAVFLHKGGARDCDTHWEGPADFLVEIVSPGDQTRQKITFYEKIGVEELLIVDRSPWKLEMLRRHERTLRKVGQATVSGGEVLVSQRLPLEFRLVAEKPRPRIEISHPAAGQRWLV
jgi:Uma2 family endonuclease